MARHARVSRQTVSNVLNAPHVVRQETRQRVEEAIAALGYRANQAARQMRTGRSRLIAARIEPTRDGINGSVLDRFLHGLTETADAAGYRVLLYTATDHEREIATYDDLLGTYELDAFVLVGTTHGDPRTAWLAARDVPFVTFGRPWDALDSHPWVDVDGAAGTARATRHLLDTGHRRIAFLGWPVGSGVGDDRRAGWHDTLRAAGVDPTGLHRETEDGIAEGERLMRDLLHAAAPTAVVCASDSLALGALQAIRGIDPPASVIGFDDTPVAAAVGLTSVSQPLGEAAARCVDLLTGVLDDDHQTPAPVLLQPALALRHTA
ncbi:LacI family DNA-binding transcriptional regulator [Micromonospora sp. WMMD1155]|uniref:LacI family DNA-binding transcriptional regulator n=1 Tax=Micromonospora sp. WMMD1155 TaxID=3016094 RepID=UPI00249BB0BA|nr:LacI family DNA-binding transcriptional regulator [Micromonospora sp. WMMD1155]WFE49731.1 LacI family DNA-binding transcriptional regulator [Micromonospora sp. WMMD1155]